MASGRWHGGNPKLNIQNFEPLPTPVHACPCPSVPVRACPCLSVSNCTLISSCCGSNFLSFPRKRDTERSGEPRSESSISAQKQVFANVRNCKIKKNIFPQQILNIRLCFFVAIKICVICVICGYFLIHKFRVIRAICPAVALCEGGSVDEYLYYLYINHAYHASSSRFIGVILSKYS